MVFTDVKLGTIQKMAPTASIAQTIAIKLGKSESEILDIADELFLQLHKRLCEYEGANGDYIGEELKWEFNQRAYFHFLGFLDIFASRYQWETGTAIEYLLRLGSREEWGKFQLDTQSWSRGAKT